MCGFIHLVVRHLRLSVQQGIISTGQPVCRTRVRLLLSRSSVKSWGRWLLELQSEDDLVAIEVIRTKRLAQPEPLLFAFDFFQVSCFRYIVVSLPLLGEEPSQHTIHHGLTWGCPGSGKHDGHQTAPRLHHDMSRRWQNGSAYMMRYWLLVISARKSWESKIYS